jgi:hypothetical protein
MAAIDDLSKATTTYFAWQTGATIYAQMTLRLNGSCDETLDAIT